MDIKLIDKKTDIKTLLKSHKMTKVDWDVKVKDKSYDIYRVGDYYHTIGGKWGNNNLWACPAGEKPTVDNLIEYNSKTPVVFGIHAVEVNTLKTKWDETSIEDTCAVTIMRNDEPIYTFNCNDFDYGLAKARYYLTIIQEDLTINVYSKNWKEELIGKTIYYKGQPAKVERLLPNNPLQCYITPIEEPFNRPEWADEDTWREYKDGMYIDLIEDIKNVLWVLEKEK